MIMSQKTLTKIEVQEKVIEIITDLLMIQKSDDILDKVVIDDLGADSLDGIEIAMALEDYFDFNIDDDEIERAKKSTPKDIIDYVVKRLDIKE
jgi:acyl carrier protein